MQNQKSSPNPLNYIGGAIMMVAFFVILFYILRGLFWLMWYASPIFIIVALVVNYKVVVNFLKTLFNWTRQKPVVGIVAIILSIVGFPAVSLYLMGKALLLQKLDKFTKGMQEQAEAAKGEFIEYEEVKTEQKRRPLIPESLDLPEIEEAEIEEVKGEYDEFFDEDAQV